MDTSGYYFDGTGPTEYEQSSCDTCSEMPVCPVAYNVESHECARIADGAEPTAEIDHEPEP